MAVTYDLNTAIGQVRFHSGDKNTDAPWLQDEEIQVFLDARQGDVRLAALDALDSVIQDMAMAGSLKSDWLSVDYSRTIPLLKKRRLSLAIATGAIQMGASAKAVYRADSFQKKPPEDWS